MRAADAGVEYAQVVVYFGDSRHRRARVVRTALLVYGDCGRETDYLIYIRLLHLAQELSGVTREALDVAALPLGENGIESQ